MCGMSVVRDLRLRELSVQHLGVGDVGPRDVSVLKAGAESSFRVPWLISFASQHRTEYTHLGHRVSLIWH